jgi:hypothetical protein
MSMRLPLRRTLALATTALVLSALTSCGFDKATDRPYTPAAGVNNRDASVDVLNAVIVSAEDGSGTFIATLVNNDELEDASLESLEGLDQTQVTFSDFSPIEIPAGGAVNLAEEGGIEVEGEFEQGDFVPVSVQLGDGQRVEMDVVVVTNCGDFEGLDGPADCEDPDEVHASDDH